MNHDTTVTGQCGPGGRWAYVVRCCCGWTNRGSYPDHAAARAAADEHLRAATQKETA